MFFIHKSIFFSHFQKVLSGEANLTIGGNVLEKYRAQFLAPSEPVLQSAFGFAFKDEVTSLCSICRFKLQIWLLILWNFSINYLSYIMDEEIITKMEKFLHWRSNESNTNSEHVALGVG